MNSNNPFFKNKTFTNTSAAAEVHEAKVIDRNETMTVSGTINKSFLMLILLIASAAITWTMTFNGQPPMVFIFGGAIVGFILVLIATFRPQSSGYFSNCLTILETLIPVLMIRILSKETLQ